MREGEPSLLVHILQYYSHRRGDTNCAEQREIECTGERGIQCAGERGIECARERGIVGRGAISNILE